MGSVKILQTGAFQLEAGQAGGAQSPGWGESGSEEVLGANDGFPWISFGRGNSVNHTQDQSITSQAFKDVPRLTGINVEQPLDAYMRFDGLGDFLYWMWGFENSIVSVGVFVVDTPTIEPVAGAVYQDTDTNEYTFLRKETSSGTDYWVFRVDDSVVPTLQTGDLTRQSGTGDDTLTMSAHSVVMYEHLYELDSYSRHFVDYLTAEQITGWSSGDKKNRMATIGLKMSTQDFRYKNAMCKKFGFKSSSGNFWELATEFLAYAEERGDFSSSSWTTKTQRQSSDNIIAHHQTAVEVGASESTLVELGVTDFSVDVGIPLQVKQDTVSGLYMAEPIFEGKYDISAPITLCRYSADTYQDYRDAWTTMVGRISATYGYYMSEILLEEGKLTTAGPDDGDVAQELLTYVPGDPQSNNWSSWLYGNTLIQNGPVLMRVRNLDSQNSMFLI